MRISWTPRAIERAVEAAEYIAQDRPAAARRWVTGLFDRVALLRDSPQQGRVVPELGRDDVREVIHGRYRVIYRVEADLLLILTVRHVRRLLDPAETEADA